MKVRVCYDKGIKEEIKREMLKRYKKIYKIECFYRIEEE